MKKVFHWIAKNERHLSTVVFVSGFVIDSLVYDRIDLPSVNTLFMGLLVAAALCIILTHFLHREQPDAAPSWRNPFYTLLPLGAQFFLGGLLSGCFIFYAKSAAFGVSWPFLALLFAVFVGNEVLRKYRERLAFQVTLFFFTLYAYAIFALPIARGKMSSLVFLESGLASIVIFGLFLWILWYIGKKRLKDSLRRILGASGATLILVNLFYFTGVMPPLPLALKDSGIYHAVVRTEGGYSVQAEERTWNPLAREVIHYVPGSSLYAFSAVFAPVSFATPIVHRWEKRDVNGTWKTVAAIAFPVTGGRGGGYRGYTELSAVTAGDWRLSIETLSGGVLGRNRFTVKIVQQQPSLQTEYK